MFVLGTLRSHRGSNQAIKVSDVWICLEGGGGRVVGGSAELTSSQVLCCMRGSTDWRVHLSSQTFKNVALQNLKVDLCFFCSFCPFCLFVCLFFEGPILNSVICLLPGDSECYHLICKVNTHIYFHLLINALTCFILNFWPSSGSFFDICR